MFRRFGTWILILANIYVFAWMLKTYGNEAFTSSNLYTTGAMFGDYFFANKDLMRLFTPSFIHTSLSHLVGNMLTLYLVGSSLERIYGHIRFFVIYLIGGLFGNLAAAFLTPDVVVAGASTSLYAMFGVLLVLMFTSQETHEKMTAFAYSGIVLINLVYNFMGSNISIEGHMGGLLGGILLGFFLSSKDTKKGLVSKGVSSAFMVVLLLLPFMLYK